MNKKPIKAWWFSEGCKLPYGDDRIIKLGETHQTKGEIIPCENGLHASKRIVDALKYAPGTIIWQVELSGTVIKKGDKLCASERTYLSGGVDCSEVLRKFTRLCALDVIESWDTPQVVIDFLKTGDENLRDATSNVIWNAVRSAARSASSNAARSVAWSAAWDATENTTWDAAWDAAWDAQNKRLTVMINKFIKFQGVSE